MTPSSFSGRRRWETRQIIGRKQRDGRDDELVLMTDQRLLAAISQHAPQTIIDKSSVAVRHELKVRGIL